MPKELKKRGRRGGKRKYEEVDEASSNSVPYEPVKRRKSANIDEPLSDCVPLDGLEDSTDTVQLPVLERPFFGMLDEEEQEHFKKADDALDTNTFEDEEERKKFLCEVYKAADGKELKIAQSQSCSRLMERLIRLSSPSQLKSLFQKFNGNFIHLATHRFASHCCEALFLRAAPVVSQELLHPLKPVTTDDANDVHVSMENLFLFTLAEFEGNLGFLITETYASHVIRVLLLVLSGEPFDESTMRRLLQSKRKEAVAIRGTNETNLGALRASRSVPKAFSEALSDLIKSSVAGLDTEKLRTLAMHPNGNPSLQLLLKLELTHFGKQRAKDEKSIIRQLLPDDPITAECGSASFMSSIVYDATGSHLVEQIVEHSPAKMFKALYKEFFHSRLGSFARNEIASFVVCRILDRLGRDDLYDAHELLVPLTPSLLQKGRTLVIRKLIERCAAREVDTQVIAVRIEEAFSGTEGLDLNRFLRFDTSETRKAGDVHDGAKKSIVEHADPTPQYTSDTNKVHFNVLAQSMLIVPGPLSSLILDAMTLLDCATLHGMAKDPVVCRTLQTALTTMNASIIQRRKLIQHFYGHIGEMAANKYASHVVDCIWEGTHGLAFIRERIAEELAENEAMLRDSPNGRAVWKNWKMDIYKRRRPEWIRQSKIKASNDGFQSFSEIDLNKKDCSEQPVKKTRLELARERYAKTKIVQGKAMSVVRNGVAKPENNTISEETWRDGDATSLSGEKAAIS